MEIGKMETRDRWVIVAEGTEDPVLFLDTSRDKIEALFRSEGYQGEICWIAEGGGMWSCELSEDPARYRPSLLRTFTHTTPPPSPMERAMNQAYHA